MDEASLRRPARDPEVWREQLRWLLSVIDARTAVLQVLPFSAGVHRLMNSHLSVLWQSDGSSVAYVEGNSSGELIERVLEEYTA